MIHLGNMATAKADTLELITENKLYKSLNLSSDSILEASGIAHHNNGARIVFDSQYWLAIINNKHNIHNALIKQQFKADFEGITFDHRQQRYYVIEESKKLKKKHYISQVFQFDNDQMLLAKHPVDIIFNHSNKGFEGLAHLYYHNQLYLFAICEGNACKSGKKSRKPGKGRIHVMTFKNNQWQIIDTIKLPKHLKFKDYSGLDIIKDTIAVVSQESSKLWLGKIILKNDHARQPDWKIKGKGKVYKFPRNKKNKKVYCNIEGVSLINDHKLAAVSDRIKRKKQHKRCKQKDQSIHFFRIP